MEINYNETSKDLLKRIDIHEKYGSRDIDKWNLEVLNPQPGNKILDVGCGAGKQCFLYSDYTKGKADITGGDFSLELLENANNRLAERKDNNVKFQFLDFNKPFDFPDSFFDFLSSAFAIYYATNLEFTFSEAHRVIKPGGKLFVTGPLPENKKMFYDIIKTSANKEIPKMPGSSRFKSEIYSTIEKIFSKTELLVFENSLTFPEVAPFMDYVRASLNEDRRLWADMFQGKEEYEILIDKIEKEASRIFNQDGKLVMTKVVGGILAAK